MFIPFESLPADSRVWIFQANRALTNNEVQIANERLRAFTDEWQVHGAPLDSSYSVRHNQFIVLAADESQQSASGCSIDSSVRVLKELQDILGVELFDRNQVAFLLNGSVTLIDRKDLKEKFSDGILNEETLTFNNLAGTKKELETSWLIAARDTWLRRYIPNALSKVK